MSFCSVWLDRTLHFPFLDKSVGVWYKDNVFRAIFEVDENYFYFRPDDEGNPVHAPQFNPYKYLYYNRDEVYSDAEMLFGRHAIHEFDAWEAIKMVIKTAVGIAAIWLQGGVIQFLDCLFTVNDFIQMMFLSASVDEAAYSAANGLYFQRFGDWAEEQDEIQKQLNPNANSLTIAKKVKRTQTVVSLVYLISDLINNIHPVTVMEQDICACLNQNTQYNVVFETDDGQVSVESFILDSDL